MAFCEGLRYILVLITQEKGLEVTFDIFVCMGELVAGVRAGERQVDVGPRRPNNLIYMRRAKIKF
jgi:hypothetical protein